MSIKIKRAYEEPTEEDGVRILVDRIWPRGVSKQKIKVDYWMKNMAPSNELRKWFNHDPDKFQEFKEIYQQELNTSEEKRIHLNEMKQLIQTSGQPVTLVYGAKDKQFNQAVVLKELLETNEKHRRM